MSWAPRRDRLERLGHPAVRRLEMSTQIGEPRHGRPARHDAWSVDGEACTFIEFSAGGDIFAG